MKKELILILIIVLVVVGGVWYLGQKQSQNSSPANVMPTESSRTTVPTPQNTSASGTASNKVEESKNQISLTVSQPTDGQTTTSSSFTVKGKTSPNADVTVNDADLKADAQGNFSTTITLDEGDNDIIVTAIDDKGLSAEKDLTVTYDSGQQYE